METGQPRYLRSVRQGNRRAFGIWVRQALHEFCWIAFDPSKLILRGRDASNVVRRPSTPQCVDVAVEVGHRGTHKFHAPNGSTQEEESRLRTQCNRWRIVGRWWRAPGLVFTTADYRSRSWKRQSVGASAPCVAGHGGLSGVACGGVGRGLARGWRGWSFRICRAAVASWVRSGQRGSVRVREVSPGPTGGRCRRASLRR
jgi:hypothetical protein